MVRFYQLPKESALLVVPVEPNGPAQRSGMREGDLIVAFNRQSIAGVDELHRMLTVAEPGAGGSLRVIRDLEELELEVVPEESRSSS